MLNGHQVAGIHTQYDSNNIATGYTIYMHIDNTAASDRTEYETLDEAKLVAKKKVEDYDAEFEGYTSYKKGWYYRKTGNLIEIKLHVHEKALYESSKSLYESSKPLK